jgi:cysteine-rich repeat protein
MSTQIKIQRTVPSLAAFLIAAAVVTACTETPILPGSPCDTLMRGGCGVGLYCQRTTQSTISRCALLPEAPAACVREKWPGECRAGLQGDAGSDSLVADDAGGTGPLESDSVGSSTGDAGAELMCTPGESRCTTAGDSVEICVGMNTWVPKESCGKGLCRSGACKGSCRPPAKQCGDNNTPEICSPDGDWIKDKPCSFKCEGKGECSGCSKDDDCSSGSICVEHVCAAAKCGDGRTTGSEECDDGAANVSDGYSQKGKCTDKCTKAAYCGDRIVNGAEMCDEGKTGTTELGACNPECSGYYERKVIKATSSSYQTNFGGPAGGDALCAQEFGEGWKALLVGGPRRASKTPFKGDGQDWVIAKYTHYFNYDGKLIWRTDNVPLLGVRDGKRSNLYAPAYDGFNYPWSGWASDWTTLPDDAGPSEGTCRGWTDSSPDNHGGFTGTELVTLESEPCGSSAPLLCVEQ